MHKVKIVVCVVVLMLFGWLTESSEVVEMTHQEATKALVIHVEGAVSKEGDYQFQEVITIQQALQHIGVLEEADLHSVNLQGMITHDMLIYVPFFNEEAISLNHASCEELERISGIGPVKAQAIIAARPYQCLEDLMKVKGIGEKSYRKYRVYFSL